MVCRSRYGRLPLAITGLLLVLAAQVGHAQAEAEQPEPVTDQALVFADDLPTSEPSIWRQATIAFGFIALLGGLGLLLVRYRTGLGGLRTEGLPKRMEVLESRRAAGVHLTLVRIDDALILISSSTSGITSLQVDSEK